MPRLGRRWEIDLQGDPRGAGAYHPRALLSVWIYGFMTGVRSCRKLEAACRDQVPYMWLVGMQQPDHNTLWRFYKAHRDRMRTLLRRTVRTAVSAGLVDLAVQAVDGTRIAANASMQHTHDAVWLQRLLTRTEQAITELEAQNATGDDPVPPRLPKELADAGFLRRRVGAALARVAAAEGPRYTNLTDADAALLKTRTGGFITGYNAQAMVSPLGACGRGRRRQVDHGGGRDRRRRRPSPSDTADQGCRGEQRRRARRGDRCGRRVPFGAQPRRVRRGRPHGVDAHDPRSPPPQPLP